ncbi:MAG TPA: hypothetical protein VG269_19500 [Tepidisphaeraceae bacterium]|jgi:hypothetical protein|nr:hypothetical protein [Tepidisphaeraceae bacterium]
MFRLLKLATFAFLGYALYEFFRGMTSDMESGAGQGGRQGWQRGQRGSSQSQSGSGRSQTRGERITGPGEGMSVQTQDANGGAIPHTVGRGIVQR